MFARHGAVELEHEIGDRVGDGDHFVALALCFEIDQRPDMHAADGAMAVVAGHRVVIGDDLAKAFDKLRQLRRRHGGVFDKGDRLLVALDAEQETEPRLAHAPDRFHLFRFECQRRRVADLLALAQFFELVDLLFDFGFGFAGVLDHQERIGRALDKAQLARLLDVAAGEIENHLVGGLHRVGRGLQERSARTPALRYRR